MDDIRGSTLPSSPVDVVAYVDAIAIWLKAPLDHAAKGWVRRHCACIGRADDRPARFDRQFRQRLFIVRPDKTLVCRLAQRDDSFINYAEFALDWVFESEEERDQMFRFAHKHLVRGHHTGRRQKVRLMRFWNDDQGNRQDRVVLDPVDADIRYDAGRGARNKLVTYREAVSRTTGQPGVIHHEWRAASAQAVRAAGINCPGDLVGFDHRAFWERRMKMVAVDLERVGRLLRNRRDGTRSRKSVIKETRRGRRRRNDDLVVGDRLGKAVDLGGDGTVQDFVDKWRSLGLAGAFSRIDCECLLPVSVGRRE